MTESTRAFEDDIVGAVRSHQTLLSRLVPKDERGLHDEHVARPSNLPGWSVGHVLAHLALDAESMVHLCEAAEQGRITVQYPGGASERAAHIDRDARAPARSHIERLRDSIDELEGLWLRVDRAWTGRGEMVSGAVIPITDLPLRRWREVEVRMGDLGISELGCDGPNSWSTEYIRRDVRVLTMQWTARGSMGMNTLPSVIERLDDRARLAWLLGRAQIEGIEPAGSS